MTLNCKCFGLLGHFHCIYLNLKRTKTLLWYYVLNYFCMETFLEVYLSRVWNNFCWISVGNIFFWHFAFLKLYTVSCNFRYRWHKCIQIIEVCWLSFKKYNFCKWILKFWIHVLYFFDFLLFLNWILFLAIPTIHIICAY